MAVPPPRNDRLLDLALTRAARRHPAKRFLADQARAVTYGEAEQIVDRLAACLRDAGLRRGDRVLLFAPNRVEVPLAALAALRCDGVFVPVHPGTKVPKLRYLLADSGARALLVDPSTAAVAAAALAEVPEPPLVLRLDGAEPPEGLPASPGSLTWADAVARYTPPPPRRAIDQDLAALFYTSGSRGQPKGVMLTHANLVHTSWSIAAYLENVPEDVILDALPLSFDYGFFQVLTALQVGATVLLEPGFTFPFPVLQRMQQEEVTGFPGVPTMFALLLGLAEPASVPLPRLRYLTNTADVLPPEHIRRLRALFPRARLYSMYGLTECTRVSYLPPEELDSRPTSVGRAIPNTEAWIARADGGHALPGEEGILQVRGAHVAAGYWRSPELTAARFRPGVLLGERVLDTGDRFVMDEEGYLYFRGRSDDILKCRGEKISPREIEAALVEHPAVAEAAVVGAPDPVLGQAIVAHLAPAPGGELALGELRAWCRQRLDATLLPQRFVVHAGPLPRNDNGKVDRVRLLQETADQP